MKLLKVLILVLFLVGCKTQDNSLETSERNISETELQEDIDINEKQIELISYTLSVGESITVEGLGTIKISKPKRYEVITDIGNTYPGSQKYDELFGIKIDTTLLDDVDKEKIKVSMKLEGSSNEIDPILFRNLFFSSGEELEKIHVINPKLGIDKLFNFNTLSGGIFAKENIKDNLIINVRYENLTIDYLLSFNNAEKVSYKELQYNLVEGPVTIPGFATFELLESTFKQYREDIYTNILIYKLRVIPENDSVEFKSRINLSSYITPNISSSHYLNMYNNNYLPMMYIDKEVIGHIAFVFSYKEVEQESYYKNLEPAILYLYEKGTDKPKYQILIK